MNNIIEYQKVVDIIDEGVMQLSIYEKTKHFPLEIKTQLIDILNFLNKTVSNKIDKVLFDKNISIDLKSLNNINRNLSDFKVDGSEISSALEILQKLDIEVLSSKTIKRLEQILINISMPVWNSIIKSEINE